MPNHPRLIVANWKSHKTLTEAIDWMKQFRSFVETHQSRFEKPGAPQVVIAPPYPFLYQVAELLTGLPNVSVGVQDTSPFPAGKYTGAVSARNLEGLPITHAIVGHSERRRYFHETNQEVANKIDLLIEAGITPIVCVDQPYIDSQAYVIDKKIKAQCVIAYEPIESIGTGLSQEVAKVLPIVEEIKVAFGNVPIIYGGSVDLENIDAYLLAMDGVLVGGASLEVEGFTNLCKASVRS